MQSDFKTHRIDLVADEMNNGGVFVVTDDSFRLFFPLVTSAYRLSFLFHLLVSSPHY